MTMEHSIRRTLRTWVAHTNGEIAAEALRDDTPILEHGIITSLDAVELILLLEELRGAPIDVERLDPASLRDIDSIWRAFFAGGAHDGR